MHAASSSFTSLETASAADWSAINASANHKAELQWVCDNVIAMFRLGLAGPPLGWAINYAQHCLQAATRAYRANLDDETVFCALMHDATETIDAHNHAHSAAALLRPLVTPLNHWMVEHHGIFQNAHCLQHPSRFNLERERHIGQPGYERTRWFCAELDQNSFDPRYPSLPLEYFEPLLRRYFASASPVEPGAGEPESTDRV
jgi:predicted HD phosphohydrolase